MCCCDVRTTQTKPTMYKQCKQNSLDFAKKALVIKLDPPKDLEKSTRLLQRFNMNQDQSLFDYYTVLFCFFYLRARVATRLKC